MLGIDIREIDVHDEAQLHQWWQTSHAAHAPRPIDVYPPWEHSRVALPLETPEHDVVLLGAFDADAMVGSARVSLPMLDNPESAFPEVTVPPAYRRRGHGSALLVRIELANHRSLRAAVPECTLVLTENALANEHMNAVNDAMGYRLVEQLLEVQKTL